MKTYVVIAALTAFATAHFHIIWPESRGDNEQTQAQYPCGGLNNAASTRTQVPLGGGLPIQLRLGHTASKVQVVLALGDSPSGADFAHVLVPTLQENGPQNFCLGDVNIPRQLPGGGNATAMNGMNGTLMVITGGDDPAEGGLYNCADITFTDTPLSQQDYNSHCTNSTGVRVSALPQEQAGMNANGTMPGGATAPGAVTTSGPSDSASTASPSPGAGVILHPPVAGAMGVCVAVFVATSMGFGLMV